ncbi:MAG: outer membrane beta-barrel protein [Candidatus Coatesbacteria bacterium]|nr:MAG: outer membrane beta-barrel protein [Candidatus Coatesbacteria bacterium]
MRMRTFSFILAGALAALPALSSAQGEGTETTEEKRGYLPASIYPAAYVFGGVVEGPTYDAANRISALAEATGSTERLADIGQIPAFGFGVDLYLWGGLSAGLKLGHAIGTFKEASVKYPAEVDWKWARINIEEKVAYRFQNVDYKITLKYTAPWEWFLKPYVAAGLGGNSTVMRLIDDISDLEIEKRDKSLLLEDGKVQQYSFDYLWGAGLQANLGDHFFLLAEYNADHQFRKHKIAGYEYDTSLEGIYLGAGWRFDY